MKMRIKSRVQIAKAIMDDLNDGAFKSNREIDASHMMLHLLDNGTSVRIYEDRDLGGTTIEIPD